MGFILAFIRIVIIGITMGAYLLWLLLLQWILGPDQERGFRYRRAWARLGTSILGIQVEDDIQQHEKPVLFISNHRSIVDPMIIAPYCDSFVIAKAEVSNYPILGKGAEATGVVWVQRDSKDSRAEVRKLMREIFERGENVMVFAEGTIAKYETTKDFRMGSFIVAAEMGIPVVPIILEYRDDKDLWRRNNIVYQYFHQFNHLKTFTKLHVGPKIINRDANQLMQKTKDYIDEHLLVMHQNWTTMNFEEQPKSNSKVHPS